MKSEYELDRVVQLLKRDATRRVQGYQSVGLKQYQRKPIGTRVNVRFLDNLVKGQTAHNQDLLDRELENSASKLERLRGTQKERADRMRSEGYDSDGEGRQSRRSRHSDRRGYLSKSELQSKSDYSRCSRRRSVSPGHARYDNEDSRSTERHSVEERTSRHHRGESKESEKYKEQGSN